MKALRNQHRQLSNGDPPSLSNVAKGTRKLPNRGMLYAAEKWGKTSFAAQAPKPIFLLTKGEDGLETLINAGQLSETPHFASQARTWLDVMSAIGELTTMDHDYKTFVLDTTNGAERLLFENVCETNFKGDWEQFHAWARGPNLCVAGWIEFLDRLDCLRVAKNMSILLLAHRAVAKFSNPNGMDYDRYQPELDRKYLWPVTHKWLDMILFGVFEEFTEKEKGKDKAKATGGQTRLIYTEHHAAYDAGNRHGLPPEIECGDTPQAAWQSFIDALTKDK